MAGKRIVVLGGGVGGLVAARRRLRAKLGPEHLHVLPDRTGRHVFWPSLLPHRGHEDGDTPFRRSAWRFP